MTTLNGIVRSFSAAIKRAEKEQQRQTREIAKRFREQQKLEIVEDTLIAVSDYNAYVSMLQSIHKSCNEKVNWQDVKQKRPLEPAMSDFHEHRATKQLKSYRASIWDIISGAKTKKTTKLKEQLVQAILKDKKENKRTYQQYVKEITEWKELCKIAEGVEQSNPDSYKEAILFCKIFSEIDAIGSKINYSFYSELIDLDLYVNSLEIIPTYELKQTLTGKLSKKVIPKSRFNELYQDHICSAVIRIARELFALLPIKHVRINAISSLLNSQTGHLENQPILSVIIPSETLQSLNFETIDPSDSMRNFLHNMNFKKTTGFKAIAKIDLPNQVK